MGTRADFYVGRGTNAEWLGSIGWDGYPDAIPGDVLEASDEATYRAAVDAFLTSRDDAARPDQGWPWPWEDSRMTDYAYAFNGGAVWASPFGCEWFRATEPEPDRASVVKVAEFPNMKDRQNVTFGERSGVVVITSGSPR